MITNIILFISSAFISFLGSIQLGPVNLAVIKATLSKGFKPALYIAIGGVIPELIYSWLAINASETKFLQQNITLLQWLIVPFFIAIGIYTIFKKTQNNISSTSVKENGSGLLFGFLLAFFNFQLFPFWLSIIVFLNSYGLVITSSFMSKFSFISGTAIGAFSLLLLIAFLTNRYSDFLVSRLKKYDINKFFGYLFILLAAIQIVKNIR